MSIETTDTTAAATPTTVAVTRRIPNSSEYLELFKADKLVECTTYLGECFGEHGAEDFDAAGFVAFGDVVQEELETTVDENATKS